MWVYPLHSPRPNRLWFWLAVTGLLAVIVVTVRATESQVCNERFTQEAPLHFVDVGTVSVLGGQRVGVDYSAPEINSPSVVGGGLLRNLVLFVGHQKEGVRDGLVPVVRLWCAKIASGVNLPLQPSNEKAS